ncbi:MAG: PAS domain S-box protein [Candidatus Hydrogenedentota bacterium]|nr:MAG: PAS domain S-box protein [Candidatus Hydrogenedentota bacterium]
MKMTSRTTELALERAQRYMGFTESDLEKLREVYPLIADDLRPMAEDFYDFFSQEEGAREIFKNQEEIDNLKVILVQWAVELFNDERNLDYQTRRMQIGRVHVERGVGTHLIIGAMGLLRRYLLRRIREKVSEDRREDVALALARAMDVELILMTESYQVGLQIRELDETTRRWKTILDQAPVVVYSYDRNGVVRYWNSEAEKIFGIRRQEAVGLPLGSLILDGEEEVKFRGILETVFSGKPSGSIKSLYRTGSGDIRKMITAHSPVKGIGGIQEGYAFCLDVTEMENIRDRFAQQEKMAALGTLAAGLAHEVGNPLSSISAICQLVQKKGDDGRLKERMETVREALGRIDETVRRVLDFARSRDEIEAVDVGNEVQNVLKLVKLNRRLRNVEIEADFESNLPLVRSTRTGFHQVVLNLLLNAVDSILDSKGVGKVNVSARRVGNGVEVSVEDTGKGFEEETLRRACEPFFSTKPEGTGLGLAVSYGIVERSGGRLNLENRRSGGGRVRFWLPAI